MPTETDPWERNAKLTGVPVEDLREMAHRGRGGIVTVRVDHVGWPQPTLLNHEEVEGLNPFRVLSSDWVFAVATGTILKTPNHIAVDGRGGAITVDPDAAPDLPHIDSDHPTDLPGDEETVARQVSSSLGVPRRLMGDQLDDGWSAVAESVGVHEGTLRAKARQALRDHGDGATVSLGSVEGQWLIDAKTAKVLERPTSDDGWTVAARLTGANVAELRRLAKNSDAVVVLVFDDGDVKYARYGAADGVVRSAKWAFDAKTARMLKGPELPKASHPIPPAGWDVGLQSPSFTNHGEQREADEVTTAQNVVLRRIIDSKGLNAEQLATLAKAYDLLR